MPKDRRLFYSLWLVVVIAGPCTATLAMASSDVPVQPAGTETIQQATRGWSELTDAERQNAVDYSSQRDIFYFGSSFYTLILLLVVLFTGFSSRLWGWAGRITRWRILALFLYVFGLFGVLAVAQWPLDYIMDFRLDHQFGLSNQTFGAWMSDWAKSFLLTVVVATPLIAGFYAIIRRRPKTWWIWMTVAAVPVLIVLIVISPVLFTPLFYDVTPMETGQLKAQILDLASQSGIPDSRVFVMDASRDSDRMGAYVTGLGQTKRIVLYDNLIAHMTPDEVLFVVGHEMGHYLLHHMWIGLGIGILLILILGFVSHLLLPRVIAANARRFGFSELTSPASLPLIILVFGVLAFVLSPAQNAAWRHFEHEADVFGLNTTRSSAAAVGAFDKIAATNLANPNPSAFIKLMRYDHPTLAERIQFAQAYEPEHDSVTSVRMLGERHFGEVTQLTFGGENAEAYFNAAGDRLIFQSTRGDYDCDRIFTMNIDGSDVRQVSVPGGVTTCAFFAPDTSRIIYCSTYLVDDSCPPKPSYEKGYVWKLHEGYDVFAADADGSNVVRLTDTPGYDAEAVFSPDGSRILFTSVRDGDLELYSMNPDGSDQTRLTHEIGYDGGGFYSPDGRQIVYRAHHPKTEEEIADYQSLIAEALIRPSKLEIFVMNADGTNRRQVTDNGAANFCPYFHPNGQQIIFASNMDDPRGRNFELYLINIDGTGLERITYNESFDGFPMFNRQGTKLVWASNRNNNQPNETNIFIADWID
ncbi:MAG: hypothetical protein Kow0074_03220 [Candidatus Zixiibacteriota bacterium]